MRNRRAVHVKLLAGKVMFVVLGLLASGWIAACDGDAQPAGEESTTSSTLEGAATSGDIQAFVNEEIKAGSAIIVVRALQATFQPAIPTQRLSAETPSAPGAGESFYQAYVRVENTAVKPLRIDPRHFACVLGNTVVAVDPTRTGPLPRSLLRNASLDLVLTFVGPAGFDPMLVYEPPWYDGIITVEAAPAPESTTTTGAK